MLSPGRTGDIKMNNLNFICQACHSRAGQPGEHATVTEQSWSRGVVTCCDKTHWPMAVILLRGVGATSRVFAVIFFSSRLQTDADFQYFPSCCSMVRGKMQESWIEPASMGFTYFHSRCKIIINPCKIYTYNNRHTHTHTSICIYIYIINRYILCIWFLSDFQKKWRCKCQHWMTFYKFYDNEWAQKHICSALILAAMP